MNFLRRVRFRRVRTLSRIMTLADAVTMSWNEKEHSEIKVRLSGRDVFMRGHSSDPACFDKVFLTEEYKLPFDTSPMAIVDAGANIGMATLYFAKTYPHAHILAIEPAPENFRILEKNCARLANVTLLQAALWPRRTRLSLYNHYDEEWAYSVSE